MPPSFYKHKLLLDEGLFSRKRLKRINSRYNIRHIKHDLEKGGISDSKVYEIACREKRVIITYNVNDFRLMAKRTKDTGIIGISQKLTPEKLDSKLNLLLSKSSERSLYGKYMPLGK